MKSVAIFLVISTLLFAGSPVLADDDAAPTSRRVRRRMKRVTIPTRFEPSNKRMR
jgi:hypothetical protein